MNEGLACELVLVVGTGVERQVVEDGMYVMLLEGCHQLGTELQRRTYEIVHVSIIGGIVGDVRQLDAILLHMVAQDAVVDMPDAETSALDVLQLFNLCPQEGGIELRRQERRTDVTPSVFVYHPPIELGTIGAFLPDNLRATDETLVVDDKHTTLSTVDVLGFMERKSSQMTDAPKGTTFIERVDAMGGILDDKR